MAYFEEWGVSSVEVAGAVADVEAVGRGDERVRSGEPRVGGVENPLEKVDAGEEGAGVNGGV